MFVTQDIKFRYLWRIRKHCKVPKYCDQDCLKLSALPMMIQIAGKSAHLAQET